eukprot:gene10391-1884_t
MSVESVWTSHSYRLAAASADLWQEANVPTSGRASTPLDDDMWCNPKIWGLIAKPDEWSSIFILWDMIEKGLKSLSLPARDLAFCKALFRTVVPFLCRVTMSSARLPRPVTALLRVKTEYLVTVMICENPKTPVAKIRSVCDAGTSASLDLVKARKTGLCAASGTSQRDLYHGGPRPRAKLLPRHAPIVSVVALICPATRAGAPDTAPPLSANRLEPSMSPHRPPTRCVSAPPGPGPPPSPPPPAPAVLVLVAHHRRPLPPPLPRHQPPLPGGLPLRHLPRHLLAADRCPPSVFCDDTAVDPAPPALSAPDHGGALSRVRSAPPAPPPPLLLPVPAPPVARLSAPSPTLSSTPTDTHLEP